MAKITKKGNVKVPVEEMMTLMAKSGEIGLSVLLALKQSPVGVVAVWQDAERTVHVEQIDEEDVDGG